VFGQTLDALNRGIAAEGESAQSAIADTSGEYVFRDVSPGEYLIAVPACGLLQTTTRLTVVRNQQSIVDISC
jgi:sarcosine oxidase gamma subunit